MGNGTEALLRYFSQNTETPITQNQISESLDLPQSTVLKQIQNLQKLGYVIETDEHQNFIYKEISDLLKPQNIQAYLKTNFIGQDLHFFPELDSEIEKAFHLAQAYPQEDESATPLRRSQPSTTKSSKPFAGNGSAIITEVCKEPFSPWFFPKVGINLFAAVVLRPGILPSRASQIALVSCVALARTLENSSGVRPQFRWPNKLMVDGKPLAEIKLRMQSNVEKINFLVIGFEVNLNGLPEETTDPQDPPPASLRSVSGKVINRPLFAASLFRELEKWYVTYINKGPEKIIREISQFFRYDKKETKISSCGKIYSGVIEGLDSDGTLLLRQPSGKTTKIPAGNIPQETLITQ